MFSSILPIYLQIFLFTLIQLVRNWIFFIDKIMWRFKPQLTTYLHHRKYLLVYRWNLAFRVKRNVNLNMRLVSFWIYIQSWWSSYFDKLLKTITWTLINKIFKGMFVLSWIRLLWFNFRKQNNWVLDILSSCVLDCNNVVIIYLHLQSYPCDKKGWETPSYIIYSTSSDLT